MSYTSISNNNNNNNNIKSNDNDNTMNNITSNARQFDWSSMIYDVFNKEKQQQQQQQQLPQSNNTSTTTSPAFSPLQYPKKENMSPLLSTVNEEVWLDDLLSDDQILNSTTQTRRNSISGRDSSSNSIFSSNYNSVLESATASFSNTPLIKAENELEDIPTFINLNGNISNSNNVDVETAAMAAAAAELSRNSSIDSMFKDIFSDIEEENDESPEQMPQQQQEQDSQNMPVKQKKKRAPRKRLTDHQKQAHNKIEKRYRININAKIAGLQKIIPWVSGEKTAFEIGDECNDKDIKDPASGAALPRMNKSMILDKATMYILYLQENEQKMKEENKMLRQKLNDMKCL